MSFRLEQEQTELLVSLVEAVRSVPSNQRQPVMVLQHMGGTEAIHPGWKAGTPVYIGDLEILGGRGLLLLRHMDQYSYQVDVTPEGFAYYAELKGRSGKPIERQTSAMRDYLGTAFSNRHASSYAKWADAEQMLWSTDSQKDLTTIGHKCREAMQQFVADLVVRYQPPSPDQDVSHVKNRLKAVIALRRPHLGRRVSNFLDALADLWDTLIDLVTRQEHGNDLNWEDGRRVVFQTAIVMFEIDRSLK